MPDVVFDEFHITFTTAKALAELESKAIHRVLSKRRFHRDLMRVIRSLVRKYPELRRLKVNLSA